jgi:hypothetical protein
MLKKTIHALAGLLRSWWQADRVRVSPSEGRLLRLRVRSVIQVLGEPAVVVKRRVGHTEEGPYVVYECEGIAGSSEIHVRPIGGTHHVAIRWVVKGKERTVSEWEIEAYPSPPAGLSVAEKDDRMLPFPPTASSGRDGVQSP